jgi:hypothetical protein
MKKPIFPILALLLASLACSLTDSPISLTPTPSIETASPESTATIPVPNATSTPDEPALNKVEGTDTHLVCFADDYEGLVRVRECPGVACREVAILPAGTGLVLAETESNDAGNWAQVTSPIEGWMNARYVCEVE